MDSDASTLAALQQPPACAAVVNIAPVVHQPIPIAIVSCRPIHWGLAHRLHIPGAAVQFKDIERVNLEVWLGRLPDLKGRGFMSPILQRAIIGQEDDFIHAMLYSLMQSTKKRNMMCGCTAGCTTMDTHRMSSLKWRLMH